MLTKIQRDEAERVAREIEDRTNRTVGERMYIFRNQREAFEADDRRRETEEDTIELARARGDY